MSKFVRPVILVKGDDDRRAREMLGEARAFLNQTLAWNRQKYFKISRLLDDGSIIQLQRLRNDQFITTLIPVGAKGELRVLSLFLTEIDISDIDEDFMGSDISSNGQGRLVSKNKEMSDVPTINDPDPKTDLEAGNVDWRNDNRLISWVGPYTRYNHNQAWYSDFSATTLDYQTFLFGPQGYALPDERIDVDYDLTFTDGDPAETRTVQFRQPIRAGTKIYENGLVLCDIDDITPPTLPNGTTGRLVLGAGLNKGDLIVMVKYVNWVDNFHLYRWDGGTSWTLLDTIDLSETDRTMPTVWCGFHFNSDATSCATVTKTYEHVSTELTHNSDWIGFGQTGGSTAYWINEEDKVQELFFAVDGNGKVTGLDSITTGAVVDYRATGAQFVVPLANEVTYHGADYQVDSEGVETMETLAKEDDNSGAGTPNRIIMAGQTIPIDPTYDSDLNYPRFADIRFNVVLTELQSRGSPYPSPGFRIAFWEGNPAVETRIIDIKDSDGKIYLFSNPTTLLSGTASSPHSRIHNACHQQCAVGRDGTLIWAGWLRFVYIDINTGLIILPGNIRELHTYSSNVSQVPFGIPDLYRGQTIEELNKRINCYYDYSVNNRKNDNLDDLDVAICPL